MNLIEVDFNARTPDGLVRLGVACALKSLAAAGAAPGARVLLTDGELVVAAVVEGRPADPAGWVARPDWGTLAEIGGAP